MQKLLLCGAFMALVTPVSAQEVPEFLNSEGASPDMPFSEAVRLGDTVYLAGQIGFVPGTSDLATGGIEGESKQVMDNIKATLESHGMTMESLVKCTVMLADMSEWGAFNDVYKTYFEPGKFPARAAFGASGLAAGAKVEVDCIAAAPAG